MLCILLVILANLSCMFILCLSVVFIRSVIFSIYCNSALDMLVALAELEELFGSEYSSFNRGIGELGGELSSELGGSELDAELGAEAAIY